MALSQDLVSQFAKLTNSEPKQNKDTTVNGTYKLINDKEYVQIDGSDIWTPVTSTVEAETGERVTVLLKDHTATVTGNISSPSARTKTVQNLKDEVDEHGNTIKQLDNSITQQGNSIIQINNNIKQQGDTINSFGNTIDSQNNKIQQMDNTITQHGDSITSMNNTITQHGNQITTMNNTIESQNNTIKQQGDTIISQGNVIVQQGNTISQQGTKIETFNSDIKILNSGFKIENGVLTGLSKVVTDELETNTLNAKYANIDFANINMAAVEKLFSDSGIIKDLIVNEGKITGELVGVTIKGDLIEGNTVKADKLVVKGEDGLFYKLNIDALGEATASSDDKYQNGLDGSVIVAKSLTADKVAVTDLVAFGATIGGFHINDHSLYSGAKNAATNTTRGIFLSDDGQLSVGDSNNYLRYFKDTDGNYKLEIGVGGSTIDETINEANTKIENLEISDKNTTTIIQDTRNLIFTALEQYVATGDLEEYKRIVSTQFEQTAKDFTFLFENAISKVNALDGATQEEFEKWKKYIRFVDGNIVLGKVGNEITLNLENDILYFLQNNGKVAYLSNNKLYVTDGEFIKSLTVGHFGYKPRKNGSLTFGKIKKQ